MAAPKGNNYWQFRDKHGRDYEYTPEKLWDEFIAYAKWIEENPLKEAIVIQRGITIENKDGTKETSYTTPVSKMRAMTIKSFCLFADITTMTFNKYENNKDFIYITTRIHDAIYSQKLEGSAAGLLQPMIIARELGLKDHQEHSGVIEKRITKVKVHRPKKDG